MGKTFSELRSSFHWAKKFSGPLIFQHPIGCIVLEYSKGAFRDHEKFDENLAMLENILGVLFFGESFLNHGFSEEVP